MALSRDAQELIIQNFKLRLLVISTSKKNKLHTHNQKVTKAIIENTNLKHWGLTFFKKNGDNVHLSFSEMEILVNE